MFLVPAAVTVDVYDTQPPTVRAVEIHQRAEMRIAPRYAYATIYDKMNIRLDV